MKKRLFVLSVIFLFSSSLFALWNDRFFEFNLKSDVSMSNNLFGITDIAKEVVEIDFTKIAEEMKAGNKDFNESISNENSVEFKIDIPHGLVFGVDVGMQLYESMDIGKELFYFLGFGNEPNQNIDIKTNGYLDLFVYSKFDIGWNTKKCKFVISPSVYSTLLHASTEGSSFVVKNTIDGKFAYELNGNFSLYSVSDSMIGIYNEVMQGNYLIFLDEGKALLQNFWQNVGLDLAANFEYDVSNNLTLNGGIRVPVLPCTLSNKSAFSVKSSWETSVMDLTQGNMKAPTFETAISSESGNVDYKINRPMKLTLGADLHAWNNVMNYYGSVGVCLEHPFSGENILDTLYFDYLAGLRVSLFNLISLNCSTERTDKVYKQKLALGLNIRLIELDVGVATASSDFMCSLKGGGLSAFAGIHLGL